jgi:alternative ribosome-rescue factor
MKKKSNPIAKQVRTPKFKTRVVKPKKGKGSFKRKKEPDEDWSGIV